MARRRKPARPGALVGGSLDDLALALRGAKISVRVATPFLSLSVAQLVVRATRLGGARDLRFLTAVNPSAVEGGYLDPLGVRAFLDSGFEVRDLRNLHAKAVLIDSTWGLIGSGNLTEAGANGGNAELGIVLDAGQTARAERSFFDRWWRASEPVDPDELARLARRKRPVAPSRRRHRGRGGFYQESPGVELARFQADPSKSGYWLKIMHAEDGRAQPRAWRRMKWVNDAHVVKHGQVQRRPGYAIGDELVVYVARGEHKACPAVFRVVGQPEFNPELVAKDRPGDERRWGWVTAVEHIASVPIRRAPTLADLGVDTRSVGRQSRIRLSPASYRRARGAIG